MRATKVYKRGSGKRDSWFGGRLSEDEKRRLDIVLGRCNLSLSNFIMATVAELESEESLVDSGNA